MPDFKIGLLHGVPGLEYKVKRKRDSRIVEAEADENGVLRNMRGQAFSAGSYEILDTDT